MYLVIGLGLCQFASIREGVDIARFIIYAGVCMSWCRRWENDPFEVYHG